MKFTIQTGTDNEILRMRSEEIKMSDFSKYTTLANAMIKYIRNPDHGGCGLAAPQIGTNKRLIVVSLLSSYDDEHYRTIAMINPEILEHSEEMELDGEWCLSLPDENADVPRYSSIKVKYFDLTGKAYIRDLSGLAARIVQHEIDHLDGILFTDYMKKAGKLLSHTL